MAPPSSRSSTPLVLGVLAIALIAFGVYWMLDEAPAPGDDGVATISAPDEGSPSAGTELPRGTATKLPEGVEATPAPLSVADSTPDAPDTLDDYLWEDPLIVTGTLEDGQQKRIPDMEVNLFDDVGDYFESVTTDSKGEFRFYSDEGLAAGWSLGTEPPFGDPDDPTLLSPAVYTHAYPAIPGKPPVHVKLIMSRPARIEGKVTDSITGAPIDSADVEVVCLSPAWQGEYQDEFTDEAGFYGMNLVDVPCKELMLRVGDDEDRYAIIGPLNLLPGEVRVIDVALTEPIGLEGVVMSAADGSAIDGAEINVLPAHAEFEEADSWSMSDSDGEWYIDDIGTQPDNIWLLVQEDEYGPVLMKVEDTRQPIEIRMGSMVTVTGQLTDAVTSDPVTDGEVRFVLKGPSGIRDDAEDMDFCAEDGSFSIPLELCPAQGALVIVEADGYVKYRAMLSDLAPTELDLRDYNIVIELTPLPEG